MCRIAREAVSLSTWSMQTGGSEGHTQAPRCWPLVARCSTPWTGLLLAAPGQAETRLSASTSRPGNTPADLAPHDLFYLNQSPCCHPCWGGALVARLCLLSQSCCLGSAALFLKPFPIQSSQDFFDLKKKKKSYLKRNSRNANFTMLAPTGQGEGVLLKHLVPKCVIANQLLSRGEKDTRKGGREAWTELVGWGQRRMPDRVRRGPVGRGPHAAHGASGLGLSRHCPVSSALTCPPQPASLRCDGVCRACGAPRPGWGRTPSVTEDWCSPSPPGSSGICISSRGQGGPSGVLCPSPQ